MNTTKIEWCDYTWNPITGCLNNCDYCYARSIANRFAGGGYGKELGMFFSKYKDNAFSPPYDLAEPHFAKTKDGWYREAPYPFGFVPTFHRYRLSEPQILRKASKVFVGSMADCFGDWVPDEWIKTMFAACQEAPQHVYLFLTKNPKRYESLANNGTLPKDSNFWYGTTVTDPSMPWFASYEHNVFLSIEPILAEFKQITCNGRAPDWVIVGAITGAGSKRHHPKEEWIQTIYDDCERLAIPYFGKDSLEDLCFDAASQSYPEAIAAHLEGSK